MSTEPSTTWRAERFSQNSSAPPIHGDVVHNGVQIAVGAGSRIEFQGTVSGAGNYFSGGTVTMNGTVRPGNGPGVVSFASDLSFGVGASLEIEIGELTAGTQYDRVVVAHASLSTARSPFPPFKVAHAVCRPNV